MCSHHNCPCGQPDPPVTTRHGNQHHRQQQQRRQHQLPAAVQAVMSFNLGFTEQEVISVYRHLLSEYRSHPPRVNSSHDDVTSGGGASRDVMDVEKVTNSEGGISALTLMRSLETKLKSLPTPPAAWRDESSASAINGYDLQDDSDCTGNHPVFAQFSSLVSERSPSPMESGASSAEIPNSATAILTSSSTAASSVTSSSAGAATTTAAAAATTEAEIASSSAESRTKTMQDDDRKMSRELEKLRALRSENRRLKAKNTCRQCHLRPVALTLLPCGHFCFCVECGSSFHACPVCKKTILADVRTFVA